jgi:hypothetical protein
MTNTDSTTPREVLQGYKIVLLTDEPSERTAFLPIIGHREPYLVSSFELLVPVEYAVGHWSTSPSVLEDGTDYPCGALCAFETLEAAKSYFRDFCAPGINSGCEAVYQIYSCDYVPSKRQAYKWIHDDPAMPRYSISGGFCVCPIFWTPSGTVFADGIRLTEKVYTWKESDRYDPD